MSTATVQGVTETGFVGSDVHAHSRQINAILCPMLYAVEDLGAGADIAARAVFQVPVGSTFELASAAFVHEGASAGIAGSPNDCVLTVRNITQGLDMATVTLVANASANATSALTVTPANRVAVASDVIGIVVTQGTAANLAKGAFQIVGRFHDRSTSRGGVVLA